MAGQPLGAPLHGWRARDLPPRRALCGNWCELLPFEADAHAESLQAALAEPQLWTYLTYGPFASAAEFAGAHADSPERQVFAIAVDGGLLGTASYLRIEPRMGSIEVGSICLAPALQRTRAATEAMYLMMRRVFDELGYRRYEWKCDALNAPSRAAAERLGFSFEGIFRQAMVVKARNRDTAWFSILDHEWPSIRGDFERWLEPANFDAGGLQRSRLGAQRAQR